MGNGMVIIPHFYRDMVIHFRNAYGREQYGNTFPYRKRVFHDVIFMTTGTPAYYAKF